LSLAGRNLLISAVSGATLVAKGVFTVLFPSDCRLCGAPLTNISRLPVCSDCISAMKPISGATCEGCGESIGISRTEGQNQLCSTCQESRPHFARAAAFGAYDRELRELIHLFKYERVEPAARVLGSMLAQAIHKLDLTAGTVLVVPVPLHRSKRRDRGFNQAELIARAALKQKDLQGEFAPDVLERVRSTISQIGLTRPQRAENIRGAFRVKHLTKVAGRRVLLVDDVLTTGTTANECARILLKAGAEKVWVATVARTLKENTGSLNPAPEVFEGVAS
jgi:ComF family protein